MSRIRTVLVVDDLPQICGIFEALSGRDYKVISAHDSTSGLEVLRNTIVDVIVTDWNMPGASGIEFLAQATPLQPDAVRILMTGFFDGDVLVDAVNQGHIHFFLRKPFQLSETRALLRQAFEYGDAVRERSEHLLTMAIQEVSQDGVLVVNENNLILSYDKRFLEVWQLPMSGGEEENHPRLVEELGRPILTECLEKVKDPNKFQKLFGTTYTNSLREIELSDGRTLEQYSSVLRGRDERHPRRVWFFRDITERKQIEDALRRSEQTAWERLSEIEQIYKFAPVGLCLYDRELRYLRINERLAAMNGIPVEEHIGRNVREVLPHIADSIIDAIRPVIESGEPVVGTEINGNLVNYFPFRSENGDVIGVSAAVLDITLRRIAEQALRQASEKHRLALDAAGLGTWEYYFDTDTVFRDSASRRMCGLPEIMDGLGAVQHIHPEDRPVVDEAIKRAIAEEDGGAYNQEYRIQWKDGSTRWISAHGRVYFEDEGDLRRPARFIGVNRDITERKRGQEEKSILGSVVANSTDFVSIVTLDGKVLFVNPAGRDIVGLGEDHEVVGTNVLDFIMEEDRERLQKQVFPIVIRDGSWQGETQFRHFQTGEPISMWQSIFFATEHGTNRRIALATISRNLTVRKHVEAELLRSKELAEAANSAKSQFLANMSHEIRTPMNGVIGMADLLLDTDLTQEQRQYAELAQDSAKNLLSIINDILDYSKIEAKKLSLENMDFNLQSCLQAAVELLATRAHQKGLELTCQVAPETPLLLRGDCKRLRQVMVNLLGNAVKFTEHGEVAVFVDVDKADENSASLRFTITDTGIGIKNDQIANLFAPFVQADGSTTRKYGGTGLGLSIAKQLIELMGGRIGVISDIGKGTTFWWTAVFEQQPGAAKTIPDIHATRSDMKILVADGNVTNRSLMKTYLNALGYRHDAVADATSALHYLRSAVRSADPFHVLIADARLLDMGMREFAETINTDHKLKGTVLLAMIRLGQRTELAMLDEGGFSAHIDKPIWKSQLGEVLALALAKKEGQVAALHTRIGSRRAEIGENPARVLLVEDNSTNQQVALAMLRKLGCHHSLACDGKEAINALKHGDYDVILMDCEMPELDGYEATRRIREPGTGARNPQIPIVALTADAMEDCRDKCIQAGMSDYLSKPLELLDLKTVLLKWTTSRGALTVGHDSCCGQAFEARNVFREEDLVTRLMGDRTFAAELVAGFLNDVPSKLSTLQRFLEAGDVNGLRLEAHTLKGAAATLSAEALSDVAAEMQHAAKANDLTAVARLQPTLELEFERLKTTLELSGWA